MARCPLALVLCLLQAPTSLIGALCDWYSLLYAASNCLVSVIVLASGGRHLLACVLVFFHVEINLVGVQIENFQKS